MRIRAERSSRGSFGMPSYPSGEMNHSNLFFSSFDWKNSSYCNLWLSEWSDSILPPLNQSSESTAGHIGIMPAAKLQEKTHGCLIWSEYLGRWSPLVPLVWTIWFMLWRFQAGPGMVEIIIRIVAGISHFFAIVMIHPTNYLIPSFSQSMCYDASFGNVSSACRAWQ